MKPIAPLICVALLLATCAPMSLYYRPGVSVARMQTDTTRCEVRALKQAPVATQIRQYPPTFVPGVRHCNAKGECWTRPGHWVDGAIYSVDVNSGLRARVMQLCMSEKGYDPVSLPICPVEVRKATPPGVTTVLPRLSKNACVIRNQDGSWQIVAR
ncbi:hypothetical protein [Antarcticimicrobium sediminis]|uniref:Uncharacterized protein n=1 Tax=Antarcticimicrobium sediminis TaxID=2546227 RepID=A0A4R5EU87_9RHOB|nr:hypothetical protein [Antarcticimicrobium sediminis]TDE38360.1 hypothetical protein E1B25_09560 [Antarcticimicrobium sediminis]